MSKFGLFVAVFFWVSGMVDDVPPWTGSGLDRETGVILELFTSDFLKNLLVNKQVLYSYPKELLQIRKKNYF